MATIMNASTTHIAARRVSPAAIALTVSAFFGATAGAQVLGFVEDFSVPGTNGWTSFNANTNPGTGGVGGADDGYLNIAQFPNAFNFGSHNDGLDYVGNWTAAGITQVSFSLNDVNTDEDFSFHFLVTGDEGSPTGESSFQYNLGFNPPNGAWQQYVIDFADPSAWTRIRGDAELAVVLADVADAHFRHDLAPFITNPDQIAGDIGIDDIALLPAPGALPLLAGFGLVAGRRRSRA